MVMPVLLFPDVIISSFSNLVVPEYAYFDTKKSYDHISYLTGRIFRITFLFSFAVFGVFFFYAKEISFAVYQNFEIANYLKEMGHNISKTSIHRYGKPFLQKFESVRLAKEYAQLLAEDNAERPTTE